MRYFAGYYRVLVAVMALFAIFGSGHANAQVIGEVAPPPVRQSIDENGVDVIRGIYLPPAKSWLSIGPEGGTQGLAFERIAGSDINSLLSAITLVGNTTVVNIGTHSDSFVVTSNGFQPTEGNGAKLFATGNGTYTYTARDGTIAAFATTGGSQYPFLYGEQSQLATVSYPDGTGFTVTTRTLLYCEGGYDGNICQSQFKRVSRVQSIQSRNGYQLKVSYANNSDKPDGETLEAWSTITSIKAINNAVEYCNPAADSCAFVNDWPGPTSPPNFVTITAANGKVATATNRGITYTYAYSDSGSIRTTTVTDPNGGVRTYVGDTSIFRLISFTDELNRTTSYTYGSFARLARVTAPEGNYTELTYDSRGNITSSVQVAKAGSGLANITTSATYPFACTDTKTCNKPLSTTDAKGNVTDFAYDAAHGGVMTVTRPAPSADAARPQTRYSYAQRSPYFLQGGSGSPTAGPSSIWVLTGISACSMGTSCSGGAAETKTIIDYGPQISGTANNLLPVSVSSGAGDNSLTATTAFTYDAIGNRTYVDGPLSGTSDTARILYDALRLPVGVIGPDPDGAGALKNRAQRVTYDANRLVTLTEQGTTTGQTDAAWAAFATLQSVASVYDTAPRKTRDTFTASGGAYAVQDYGYDALGRPECSATRMNSATWSSLPGACTLATTGALGPDRIARTIYNAAGQVLTVQSAYGTAAQADEVTNSYTLNAAPRTVADAKNNLTTYEYDGFDRLLKLRYPSPTTPGTSSTTDYAQYSYDAASNLIQTRRRDGTVIGLSHDALNRVTLKDLPGGEPDVSYAYDNLGRATAASSSVATLGFAYDQLGRLTRQTSPQGDTDYRYDLANRRTRLTWPDGFYVSYEYLVAGEMAAIRENGSALLASFSHDDAGRRTSLARGNGTTTSYCYGGLTTQPGCTSTGGGVYLTGLVQDLAGTPSDQSQGFAYNPAAQITQQTRSNDAYAFRRTYNTDRGYTANGLNQFTTVGTAAPGYDARGNLTSLRGRAYAYSSENLLTSATGATGLAYDPALRLYQVDGASSARFGYDGADMIAEYSTANALQRRYVHGPGSDEPLVWYEGAGTTDRRWLHADERGSVTAVSNGSGAATAINSYDEYGMPATGNIGRFQYTGQMWLSETGAAPDGLYHYKARAYSPRLGRFMQTDPIGYAAGMNLYAYVRNDPINFVDPSGLDRCPDDSGDICVTGQLPFNFDLDRLLNRIGTGRPFAWYEEDVLEQCGLNPNGSPQQCIIPPLIEALKDLTEDVRDAVCGLPSIDIGFGADAYAGIGGSIGVGLSADIASGQIGIGFNVAVGAGVGFEVGPSVGGSPSGSGVVSANVTVSGGGGLGVGVVGTRNVIGTDSGQTGVSVGRVGTPVAFVNGGAAAGFATPKTNPLGCKSR